MVLTGDRGRELLGSDRSIAGGCGSEAATQRRQSAPGPTIASGASSAALPESLPLPRPSNDLPQDSRRGQKSGPFETRLLGTSTALSFHAPHFPASTSPLLPAMPKQKPRQENSRKTRQGRGKQSGALHSLAGDERVDERRKGGSLG